MSTLYVFIDQRIRIKDMIRIYLFYHYCWPFMSSFFLQNHQVAPQNYEKETNNHLLPLQALNPTPPDNKSPNYCGRNRVP